MVLEVCCTGIESALKAEAAGANRIELCMHLGSGGLTPSHGLLSAVLDEVNIPVFVLIRPREGNFVYSRADKNVMREDIRFAVEAGAHGIVCGALCNDGTPDLAFIEEIKQLCGSVPLTFHRAFDECTTPAAAATALHQLGVERILSSGQELRANEGTNVFRALLALENCPTILAGGGVTPENVGALVELGIQEFHFSARTTVHGAIGRGIFDPAYDTVNPDLVRTMRDVLSRAVRSSSAVQAK